MGKLERYYKNIAKQYGKHLKAVDSINYENVKPYMPKKKK